MSLELYACLDVSEFPLQALSRLCPDIEKLPVAVLDGSPPQQTICSANQTAQQLGCAFGMTKVEAEGIPGLKLLTRSSESEAVAIEVFLECVSSFSPRIEERAAGTHRACILDIAGTERLFGPPHALANRMSEALASAGLHASVAVSANFHTAVLKASATHGISIIRAGQEAAGLAPLSIGALDLAKDEAETLAAWGIQTLGQLAALPEEGLIARLGQQGKHLRDMASGALPHLFQPIEPKVQLKEYCEFEPPIDQMDSLLFVAAPMLDSLASRASRRALLLAHLNIVTHLENKQAHTLTISPALPTIDRKFLLKLLQIELSAHPPPSAVIAFTMEAEVGHGSKVQLGLFSPQLPESARLDITLARLKAIVGEDMVGSPILTDSNRGDEFRMEAFTITQPGTAIAIQKPRMALRRMRPPHPVQVRCSGMRPIAFYDGRQAYSIFVAYGPWRSSGCWWTTDDWDRDEWDVLITQEQQAYLLINDRRQGRWYLEAVYD